MIEAIDLTKRYSTGRLALDALNLRVRPGEIHCLLGASGAGKSTALHLLLGFLEPTAGRALIDGIDARREPLLARSHSAYLAGGTAFYERLTARQNLSFFAALGGRSGLRQKDLDLALREVGLPEAAFPRRVRELGPGARQRLGLAAALLKDAPALLLDDPLAGVDLREASGIVEILEGFRRRGKAILFATQDVGRAHQLADRVSVLQEGRTALTCSREELRFSNLDKLYLDYMQGDLNPEAGSPFP